MSNIFNKDDIRAGYLLRVKNAENGNVFSMTVVPTTRYTCSLAEELLLGHKSRKKGDLACCYPGAEWWPLSHFNANLETPTKKYRVVAVYGYAPPKYLLNNSPEAREVLWTRDGEDTQPKPEPQKMTVAEIAEKLGYQVEIVEG